MQRVEYRHPVAKGTYGIDTLQEGVSQDVKGHIATALDSTIDISSLGFGETEILLLHDELLAADSKRNNGKVVLCGIGGIDITLGLVVIVRARDSIVNSLAGFIVHQRQRCASVSDRLVSGARDRLSIDRGGSRLKHPEPFAVVDRRVGDLLPGRLHGGIVDEPECIEGLALVGLVGIPPRAQLGREQSRRVRNVILGDHVLDGRLDGLGLDGVDAAKRQPQQSVTGTLGELGRHLLGQLDGLVLDGDAADVHVVGADRTRRRGAVAVRDLPRVTILLFESARLGRVEDIVALAILGNGGRGELSGPDLFDSSQRC